MQAVEKKTYTYEDYAQLPEGAPYQLIGGELVMSPAPTPRHQRISRKLNRALDRFVEDHDLGEVFYAPIDVYLSEIDTPQPDILFIAKARLDIIGEKYIEDAPDLIMEILSPSTAYYDLKKKKGLYEASGVKEYWIVDPEVREIEVYALVEGRFELFGREAGQGTITSKLLAGFSVDLADVF